MRPKTFDANAKRVDFLQGEALRADLKAFETEAIAGFHQEWEAVSEPIRAASKERAEKARRYADIAMAKGKPSQKDITETRRKFLDNWLKNNRGFIVENEERIELKQEAELGDDEEPPIPELVVRPDGEQSEEYVTINRHRDNIEMFEAAVKVAERLYEKLPERKPMKMDSKLRAVKPSENGKEKEKADATKEG